MASIEIARHPRLTVVGLAAIIGVFGFAVRLAVAQKTPQPEGCSFSPAEGVVSVDLPRSLLARSGQEIEVYKAVRIPGSHSFRWERVPCADATGGTGTPTVTNVSRIELRARHLSVDLTGGSFASPGGANTSGEREIGIEFDPESQEENMLFVDAAEHDIALGTPTRGGLLINLNAEDETAAGSVDADLRVASGTDDVTINAGGSGAVLDAGGGGVLGEPANVYTQLNGTAGRDVLVGGARRTDLLGSGGRDQLAGSPMLDQLNGGGGNDRLIGRGGGDHFYPDDIEGEDGKDVILGGAGRDFLPVYDPGVRIDLRETGPQDTHGLGVDTIRSIEKVEVNDGVVIGNNRDNVLLGSSRSNISDGSERLIGGGGDDRLQGEKVFILDGGDDILRGGSGDDVLIGDQPHLESYEIPGRDALYGEGGDDVLVARDGRRDRVLNCGSGPRDETVRRDPIDPRPVGC
jgi:hypothetical protein